MSTTTDRAPGSAWRRQLLAVGVPVLACWALAGGALGAWWHRLPTTMASHYSAAGVPDDYGSRAATLGLPAALAVLPAAALLARVWAGRGQGRGAARALVGWVVGLTAGLSGLLVTIAYHHLDVVDPATVREPVWTALLWGPPAVALGLLAWWCSPELADRTPSPLLARVPRLRPGARVMWTGRGTSSPWLLLVLAAAVVAMTVSAVTSGRLLLLLAVPVAAVVLSSIVSVRVTVDERGLVWRSGLGVPRGHVDLADVGRAEAVQVHLGDYGGWGYRVSASSGNAVVVRLGTALRVHRRTGRAFTVTVDDAATGAALLTRLASDPTRQD